MKVKELIEKLEKLPPDLVLIIQKDAEGNGYSPLEGIDGNNLVYGAYNAWSGEVKFKRLTDNLRADGYTAEDIGDGADCAVLYPKN